ncbi:uncharacterized protein BDR25DRAFT_303225 [Lindgomyces ingoldianus]|uniref:Uncharacterized protein n=1 Tax=Lindgomyces ingoldianus TaxID=673940 RepID=A0ACB6R0I6_9PLEO|nr:uncharacterized protein BDR25DRAFT_303225 [Lindgomyces ingoldianus]KAF2471830.1 hypothetical protein BDR25DRAFT_303225 [Lindgomyces ingoldianus]
MELPYSPRRKRRRTCETPSPRILRSTTMKRRPHLPAPEPGALTGFPEPTILNTSQVIEEKQFPLIELPAELRIYIYRMALQRATPLLLHLPRPSIDVSSSEVDNLSMKLNQRALLAGKEARRRRADHGHDDVLAPALLRTCSLVYKEARQILYSDNTFVLQLDSGIHTLSNLHQRSRSLIKHVSLTITSHHDILDGFADLVRLGLRYCWGLKTFTIALPCCFTDDKFMGSTTSVYANAFHILRWLTKGCAVRLEGNVSEAIRRVVEDEGRLLSILDQTSYLKRQHQMPGKLDRKNGIRFSAGEPGISCYYDGT